MFFETQINSDDAVKVKSDFWRRREVVGNQKEKKKHLLRKPKQDKDPEARLNFETSFTKARSPAKAHARKDALIEEEYVVAEAGLNIRPNPLVYLSIYLYIHEED